MFYKDLKTLFVHIPKNAGSSITNILNNNSVYNVEYEKIKHNKSGIEYGKIYHRTIKQYLENNLIINSEYKLSMEEYSTFFKFAVVREPLDRALSMYRYLIKYKIIDKNINVKRFFLYWLPKTLENKNELLNYFVLPQFNFISIDGNIVVDKILYFEKIEEDFTQVSKILNLKQSLIKINETNKNDFSDILKNKGIHKVIQNIYIKDYNNFYNN